MNPRPQLFVLGLLFAACGTSAAAAEPSAADRDWQPIQELLDPQSELVLQRMIEALLARPAQA